MWRRRSSSSTQPARLELAEAPAATARTVKLLREFAAREPTGKPRSLRLRFKVSPVAILGEGRVEAVEIVHNELAVDAKGRLRAVPTNKREVIECGAVFRSVGYLGVPLPGLPFDQNRHTLPNEAGRVIDDSGAPFPGVYCAGWIKRGPTGVIGTNKKDAVETVDLLLEDAAAGRLDRGLDPDAGQVDELLAERGVEVVTYPGWEAIDEIECAAGEPLGRPRVKLVTWDELRGTARGA